MTASLANSAPAPALAAEYNVKPDTIILKFDDFKNLLTLVQKNDGYMMGDFVFKYLLFKNEFSDLTIKRKDVMTFYFPSKEKIWSFYDDDSFKITIRKIKRSKSISFNGILFFESLLFRINLNNNNITIKIILKDDISHYNQSFFLNQIKFTFTDDGRYRFAWNSQSDIIHGYKYTRYKLVTHFFKQKNIVLNDLYIQYLYHHIFKKNEFSIQNEWGIKEMKYILKNYIFSDYNVIIFNPLDSFRINLSLYFKGLYNEYKKCKSALIMQISIQYLKTFLMNICRFIESTNEIGKHMFEICNLEKPITLD